MINVYDKNLFIFFEYTGQTFKDIDKIFAWFPHITNKELNSLIFNCALAHMLLDNGKVEEALKHHFTDSKDEKNDAILKNQILKKYSKE